MTAQGFDLVPGQHPIIPVMLGDAALATRMADALLAEGIYVIGFSYPVVPKGKARIRTQMSAAHTDAADRHGGARLRARSAASSARSGDVTKRGGATAMKALAKLERAPGLTLTRGEEARGRPQRRHDPDPEDRDLRHRHPHLEMGRLGAEDDSRADAGRPRIRRRSRRDGAGGARFQHRRPRLGRGPHHLRLLPQLPRRAPASVPQHGRRRRQPRGRVRRVSWSSRRSTPSGFPTTSPTISRRSSIRSATRRTRRSRFHLVGEDVLITGAGPIGIMAAAIARHVGARHVVITDVNDYRLGLARRMGATPRGQHRPREPARRDGGARHDRGLRRRHGDVRRARRVLATCWRT